MNKYVLPVLFCFSLFNCGKADTPNNLEMLKQIGFDESVIFEIRDILNTDFYRYQTSEPGFIFKNHEFTKVGLKDANGVVFKVDSDIQYESYEKVKRHLAGTYFFPFLTDLYFNKGLTSLVIIKGNNKFDILDYETPDGINYNITTVDLKNKLMEWDKFLNINIIGADFDWIEFSFLNLPSDITAFAEEVYNFCPDTIDGPDDFDSHSYNIEYLKNEINKKRLYLWWD